VTAQPNLPHRRKFVAYARDGRGEVVASELFAAPDLVGAYEHARPYLPAGGVVEVWEVRARVLRIAEGCP
jgi:hypothetical protein